MRFIEVKDDPRKIPSKTTRTRYSGDLIDMLDRFLTTGYKYAKLDLNDSEYINNNCAYSCIARCIKHEGFSIKLVMRNGELYLVRTDV